MANSYLATKAEIVSQQQSEPSDQQHLSPEQFLEYFCQKCLKIPTEDFRRAVQCFPQVQSCMPAIEQVQRYAPAIGNIEAVMQRCKRYEELLKLACCPDNALYGDVSRHHYSSKNIVYLNQIVQNVGPGYVNAFPVPPGSKIRLEQLGRPGFVPEVIEAHFDLANNGTNFLALQLQFIVSNEDVGSEFLGSTFLDSDGRTKRVPFPSWRGRNGIKIGSAEKVAVDITVGGGDNLELATVALHLNIEGWAKFCGLDSSMGC